MRTVILSVALVFLALFAALTLADAANNGLNLLNAASVLVLIVMGVGIVGALLHPPDE